MIQSEWSTPSSISQILHLPGDPYTCAEAANALVIVTEWEQFRALDLDRLKQVMNTPMLVDLRNIEAPESFGRPAFGSTAFATQVPDV